MARALHLVPPTPGSDITYVVARTRFVDPGRPYVLAALADPALAQDSRHAEAEVYSLAEMRSDGSLAGALEAWEAGDLELFRRDRQTQDRVEAAYRASMLRAAQRHPSMAGR